MSNVTGVSPGQAAAGQPTEGDREALANLLDEIHDPLVTEGGCHFSGWSGGGFAGQREVSESVDAILANGFCRATVPDAATETFAEKLEREHGALAHERSIRGEVEEQRDAALAAVERVRAAVNGPHPANSGLDSFTLAHISAALDGAPEPEVKP